MAEPIIVTGAAGFIGRNVVAELNARGEDELILVDELGVSKPGEPEKWKNLIGLRYEDIISPEDFLGLLEQHALPMRARSSTWARAARRPRKMPTICCATTISTRACCVTGRRSMARGLSMRRVRRPMVMVRKATTTAMPRLRR